MTNAFKFLESTALPDEDGVETVTISEAHRAVLLAIVETLQEAEQIYANGGDVTIAQLITKYKKKL